MIIKVSKMTRFTAAALYQHQTNIIAQLILAIKTI